jgi:hypothetical protein
MNQVGGKFKTKIKKLRELPNAARNKTAKDLPANSGNAAELK